MYPDKPPVTAFPAEPLVTKLYRKLLSAKTGRFCAIGATPTSVIADENSICNTISVERATVAPVRKETPTEENRTQNDDEDAESEETHARDMQVEEGNVANAPRELALDRIVRHLGKSDSVKYVVCW